GRHDAVADQLLHEQVPQARDDRIQRRPEGAFLAAERDRPRVGFVRGTDHDQMNCTVLSAPIRWRPTISAIGHMPCRCWLALMASRKRRSNGAFSEIDMVPAPR